MLPGYPPECVEGGFSKVAKRTLLPKKVPHTANGEPQAWLLY
jgi:hypothetical protein